MKGSPSWICLQALKSTMFSTPIASRTLSSSVGIAMDGHSSSLDKWFISFTSCFCVGLLITTISIAQSTTLSRQMNYNSFWWEWPYSILSSMSSSSFTKMVLGTTSLTWATGTTLPSLVWALPTSWSIRFIPLIRSNAKFCSPWW